ncbi:MAG: Ppx/GppA family phosphatase [Polyangiaceae bacterium]|nr:Ppx/GppA family phosphatase [Polyangiaceae bacterium]
MRVAAIDIGTSSVLLLVAERRDGALVPVAERATITRLGQGVDAARALAPEAVDRTLACLSRYAEEIRALGAERVDAVGTSAMRDAAGGEAFVARARELLGVAPRVISGAEEAALTFAGALTGLALPPVPRIVFDLGGGSTEIIVGPPGSTFGAPGRASHGAPCAPNPGSTFGAPGRASHGAPCAPSPEGDVLGAVSLDVGSVRLTERHVRADPPSPAELSALRGAARAALRAAPALPASDGPPPVLVGVAGTVTTIAALVHDVTPYDGARVHGARLTRREVAATTTRLAALPLAERRLLPALDPARADVIVAGSILVEEIMACATGSRGGQDESSGELIASDRGVRWGLAQQLA